MNQGSTAAVQFMGPNPTLFSKYPVSYTHLRRSDFMRHKIVHITPIVDDFIPPTTPRSDIEAMAEHLI